MIDGTELLVEQARNDIQEAINNIALNTELHVEDEQHLGILILNTILPIIHQLNVEVTYPQFFQRFEYRTFEDLGAFLADNLGVYTRNLCIAQDEYNQENN
jgi:hypothetical protein